LVRHFFFGRPSSRLSLVTGLVLLAGAAHAQSSDCRNLQAQLASLGPGDPARTAEFAKAVQKQQYELDRTVAYAHSIGCDNRQFLFFGQAPPPQCGEIGVRINRMQSNLAQLQAEAERASGDARRRDLTARFNAYCRGAPSQPRGFFDTLFGAPPPQPGLPVLPDNQGVPTVQDQVPSGGPKAVCVRTCDGAFFPISYSATRSRLEGLAQQCQALCPGAETALYTYSLSKDIDNSVSIDGKPYTDLPNAGKFRTKFDATCTCKPPGQSWVAALAGAERALGHESASDIIVTPEKSAEMSRPQPVAKSKADQKPNSKKSDAQGVDATAADGLAAQQVPTASNESAGIGPKTSIGGPAYGLSDGRTRNEVGPDGVEKKVRIIGPTL
jgi:hypothetical protein